MSGLKSSISAVTISASSDTLQIGQSLQLHATAHDGSGGNVADSIFTWSSSNNAVATVSSGGVATGIAAGTTTITAKSGGTSGTMSITVSAAPVTNVVGCANPQPGWIWCDDFETDRTSSYFEYNNPSGSFTRQAGAGMNGSTSMRARWTAGQIDAGSLRLAFGRTPSTYFRPVDAGTANYREVYWRAYVKTQAGWIANGADKFSRAVVMAKSDWSEAAIGHVWGGDVAASQNYYILDPVRGTDTAGTLLTVGYNDFAHFTWLGPVTGKVPVFGSGAGQWYCVEAHMKLNDPGQSNGVLEEWINGTLDAQRTGLNFLGSYNAYGINMVFLENYLNNGAQQAEVRDYDDFVVSTQPIGCNP